MAGNEPAVVYECAWVHKIQFAEATKTWLAQLDWPESAFDDFEKIADHNELVSKFCG